VEEVEEGEEETNRKEEEEEEENRLSGGFGIPNRSSGPLVRAGRDHPFPISAGSPWRERHVARRMRHE
jgi:hypothetical protein